MKSQEKQLLPRVAVLMATYNGEKFLSEQIDSILHQKNVEPCIFIRDDGSTDATCQIIDKYAEKYSSCKRLFSYPERLNVTKNFFSLLKDIDIADFDYLSYSDQDDIWLESKLEAGIMAIKENQVSCYASNLTKADVNGNPVIPSSLADKWRLSVLNFKSDRLTRWDHYLEAASAGCTLIITREAALYMQKRMEIIYDKIPVNTSHDWSTYAITRIGGYKWHIDKASYILYRQHNGNAYGTNQGVNGISKLIDLFRSGWYRKHILQIEEIYNNTSEHPPFIHVLKSYKASSFISRCRVAFAISRYRRKPLHRFILFFLILSGYFR